MVFCGFFAGLINCCKSNSKTNTSTVKTVRTDMLSKYSSELSFYASVCEKEPSLKSFDSLIHQRTTEVIRSLGAQAESESLPLDSLMEVYGFLLELNEDAVKVIIESKEDVWKNKDLRSLVDVYFKSTAKTLDFFNTAENCIKRTEIGQLIIRFAVEQFKTESESVDAEVGEDKKKKKYAKTLEELNKFKAIGDPFEGEFVTQYESVLKHQVQLLEELRKLKAKLNKKQRNAKTWRLLSNIVFATAIVTVLVLSVVLAAMTLPPVASAVAAGLVTPIEYTRKWCSKMWKDYEKAMKRRKDLVVTMEKYALGNKEATKTIKTQTENLRIKISSILETVEFAMQGGGEEAEELATKLAMQEIKKKIDVFAERIKEVGQKASRCSDTIAEGRLEVLDHILKLPANSVSYKGNL